MAEEKKIMSSVVKVAMPIVLGAAILYWMYRDFDFGSIKDVMLHEMDWTWMLLSMPFGALAQMFRGWRWRQTLEPVGEHPRTMTCINSIFMSYAASLVVPRIGEFTRCGVLRQYDGVSFPKSLGTVVTERAIDSLLVLAITATVLLWQMTVFGTFFQKTGTSIDTILAGFSLTGYLVTAVCGVAALILLHLLLRRLSIYNKVRATFSGIWQGVMSLRDVRNKPLFLFYTLAIWGSYFIHYYLT
ncbi:MAG: flippase-like domain-containing protein, partial [Prevotella sp.]|nr:flippase-like domain-containing protein [Prevotella sp.]